MGPYYAISLLIALGWTHTNTRIDITDNSNYKKPATHGQRTRMNWFSLKDMYTYNDIVTAVIFYDLTICGRQARKLS